MARASYRRDSRGDLYLYLFGKVDEDKIEVRRRVPGDDEDLAQKTVDEFNRRFLMGDVSVLTDAIRERRDRQRWRGKHRPRARARAVTLSAWRDQWLEQIHGSIGEHTWRSYKSSLSTSVPLLGGSRGIDELTSGDLVTLNARLIRDGQAHRTVADKIATLRRMLEAAVLAGLLDVNPFVTKIPATRTKERRRAARERVDKRPLSAEELVAILEVCRKPDADRPLEACWFPLTEALLLTGLRFGEVAALMWPVVDWRRSRVVIVRAREHYGPVDPEAATKTGAEWSIPLRRPLRELLRRQRARSYVGNPDGWVFPTAHGMCPDYSNWRNRVWPEVLRKSRVTIAGHGDAQKLLRKAYLTNSLVCGRNPKRVSSEVGHASLRMLMDQYELWLDEKNWPGPVELAQLGAIYGFEEPGVGVKASSKRGKR